MKQKGFTLIELLVVIAIIGILSTLAVVSLNNARLKSRDAKRISDIKQVQTALELFFADNNSYVVVIAPVVLGGASAQKLSGGGFSASGGGSGTVYMGQVPSNPGPGGVDYSYKSTNADNTDCISGTCVNYALRFTLEGQTGGLTGAPHTASPSGIQ